MTTGHVVQTKCDTVDSKVISVAYAKIQDTTIPPPHTPIQVHEPSSSNSFTETFPDVTYSLEQKNFRPRHARVGKVEGQM